MYCVYTGLMIKGPPFWRVSPPFFLWTLLDKPQIDPRSRRFFLQMLRTHGRCWWCFFAFRNFQFSFQRSIVNVIYVYIHIYTIYKYIYIHIFTVKRSVGNTRDSKLCDFPTSFLYMDTSPPALCLAPMSPFQTSPFSGGDQPTAERTRHW